MPPSQFPPHAPDSFSKTLELLTPLADTAILDWAGNFDWTMPVPVSHVVDGALVDNCVSATDRLLETADGRLIELLLRPDMFQQDYRISTASNIRRTTTTAWGQPYTEDGLWRSAWFQAVSMGRVDLARHVAQVAGTSLALRIPGPDLPTLAQALHKAPYRARATLITHLLVEDDNAVFRRLATPLPPQAWLDDRRGELAFELAKLTSELGMFDLIMETLPGHPPAKLLIHLLENESPHHKAMGQALSLLDMAARRGGFRGQTASGKVSMRAPNGFDKQWCDPMELMVSRLAKAKIPDASFRKLATRLLAWPVGSPLSPDPIALTQACARRCIQWNQELLDLVRSANPNPTPRELAWLMLGATEECYQARLEDFLAATPSQEAWESLAKCLDGSATQHAQAASVSGKSSKNAHHTNGFPRLWQRAAAVVSGLSPTDRPGVDEAFQSTIASNHRDNPELAARMLSIYQTARLELSTSQAPAPRPRGPRL